MEISGTNFYFTGTVYRCFLVTYFYTHKVLAAEPGGGMSSADEGRFIEKFGSYLQLHSCLSFAASVRDESAIAHLLNVADYDPNHRDAAREIQKSNEMLFYDTVSALFFV